MELRAALIGSCTNSSYEDLSRAADLARQALDAGLKPRAPLFISPGSERIYRTIERDGHAATFQDWAPRCSPTPAAPASASGSARTPCPGGPTPSSPPSTATSRGATTGAPTPTPSSPVPEMVMAMAFGGHPGLRPGPRTACPARTAAPSSFAPPMGEELPAGGLRAGRRGLPCRRPRTAADVAVEIAPDSERLSLLEPFPPGTARTSEACRCSSRPRARPPPTTSRPAGPVAALPRPPGQDQRQHVPGRHQRLHRRARQGHRRRHRARPAWTIAQIARDYKAEGHRNSRRRRRELRRRQQPGARGDVARATWG